MAITIHHRNDIGRKAFLPLQRTFATPLREIDRFVDNIFAACPGLGAAKVDIYQVVFQPKNPPPPLSIGLWSRADVGTTLLASSFDSARLLLIACLSEWMDFVFAAESGEVQIYADHDEYCTFYASNRSALDHLCRALVEAQFTEIKGYKRVA